ncbi:MAG: ABC transporter substrate-binding protein [Oscillospiraceae bacterium]|nr:ABC transporter substrate-binding protein [Oscillospiraceae bacterium]
MKKKTAFGFLAFICVCSKLLVIGAAASAEEPASVTVVDDLGREVIAPYRPQRVAALLGSFADIWTLADGPDSLVAAAEDTWTSFDLDLGEDVVNLGPVRSFDLEKLIASEPDLILASSVQALDLELLPTFEELGYPVVYFDVSGFAEYLHMLEVCTQITGAQDRYTRYGSDVVAQVDAAIALQDGSAPSVLYIRASSGSFSVKGSEGNVLGEMLAALGCRNIADGDNSLLENLSLEVILEEDPDYIFIVYQAADPTQAQALLEESLLSNPAWSGLRAVQEGRVFVLEHRLYNLKPNAQWGAAYEALARILYGDDES